MIIVMTAFLCSAMVLTSCDNDYSARNLQDAKEKYWQENY